PAVESSFASCVFLKCRPAGFAACLPRAGFISLANHPLKRPRSWATRAASLFSFASLLGLLADLPADGVFLLVERFLLGGRDVAVVELRHRPLLLADRVVLAMQLLGLALGDFALPQLAVDAPVLILQAVVDLGAPRVVPLPLGLGRGACHVTCHGACHGDPGE